MGIIPIGFKDPRIQGVKEDEYRSQKRIQKSGWKLSYEL
jgi:hypothetical protein